MHHIQTLRHHALCHSRHCTGVHLRLSHSSVWTWRAHPLALSRSQTVRHSMYEDAHWFHDIPCTRTLIGFTTFHVRGRSLVSKLSRLPFQRHRTNYCRQYVSFRQQPLLNAIWKLIFLIVPLLKFYLLYSYSSGRFCLYCLVFTTRFNSYVHCETPLADLHCNSAI